MLKLWAKLVRAFVGWRIRHSHVFLDRPRMSDVLIKLPKEDAIDFDTLHAGRKAIDEMRSGDYAYDRWVTMSEDDKDV